MANYAICLPEHRYEYVLPQLAGQLQAPYVAGTFDAARDAFVTSRHGSEEWLLVGRRGKLIVKLEEHEDYLFCELFARGPELLVMKQLLWNEYLAAGGNPEAQDPP